MRLASRTVTLFTTLSFATTASLAAQDTRSVTEPKRPVSCVTLPAALTSVGDSTLNEPDEKRQDTQRIQKAIDACASGGGHTVVLARDAGASRDAFLTGPIRLR